MEFETHRRALRGATPWILVALFPLVLSVALPAAVAPFAGASAAKGWIASTSVWLGALGSAAMLFGTLQLSRACIDGHYLPSLMLSFLAWAAEFSLRIYALSAPEPASDTLLAARLVASSVAMLALSSGVARVIARQGGRAHVATWRMAQLLFASFTALLAVALASARWLAPEQGLWGWIESVPLGAPLAWLAFAIPWVWLVLSVRRSVRWVGRTQSVSDILAR